MGFTPFNSTASPSIKASTGPAGFALQNATPVIASWTAPNDGQMHYAIVIGSVNITVTEVGGGVTISYTHPLAGAQTYNASSPNDGPQLSAFGSGGDQETAFLMAPGTTISVVQTSALTAGTAVVNCVILGS